MRKPLTIAGIVFFVGYLSAQSLNFAVTNSPYTKFEGGTSVNQGKNWNYDREIPLGFTFTWFGTEVDTLVLVGAGNLLTNIKLSDIDGNKDQFGHLLYLNPDEDLTDREVNDEKPSQSPITYHLTGQRPNRIGILQYENAGFYDDLRADGISDLFTNFQLWLYEVDGTIELHYGESSPAVLAGDSTVSGGVAIVEDYAYIYSTDEESFLTAYYLKGEANNPTLVQASLEDSKKPGFEDSLELSSFPASGTIYRFTTTGASGLFGPAPEVASFDVFPNPTADRFYLRLPADLSGRAVRLAVFDVAGRQVRDQAWQNDAVDLSGLPGGLYQLRLRTDTGLALSGRVVKH